MWEEELVFCCYLIMMVFTGTIDTTTCPSLIKFVTYSPNLTSLTLINFPLTDEMAGILAESSHTLKYLNLSRSSTIKGRFLRDLGHSCKDSPLKTPILRNCFNLEEREVLQLCESLVTGGFKSIQHIDVSNKRGLLAVGGKKRSYKPNFPLEKLKEERPDVTFVADFPLTRPEECYHVCCGVDEEALRVIEKMECDENYDTDNKPD